MGKGAFAASDKGVFISKRRQIMFDLICDKKKMSLDELFDYFSKTEDPDIRINDKKNVKYNLEILIIAKYVAEETVYGRKIYRKTMFSSKNL